MKLYHLLLRYDRWLFGVTMVELFGSWDGWSCGIRTTERYAYVWQRCELEIQWLAAFLLPDVKASYEYKFKVTYWGGRVEWHVHPRYKKVHVGEWNENNVFIVN